jgi:hypothetical protein
VSWLQKTRTWSKNGFTHWFSFLWGSVHVRLHWPFGLRPPSDHGLLIRYKTGAAQSANLRTCDFRNCERLLRSKLVLAPFAVELP